MTNNGPESDDSQQTPMKPSSQVIAVMVLASIEALGILAIVVWYLQHTLAGEFFDLPSTLFQIFLAVLAVAWVIGGTFGVWRHKSIARALLVTFQIILIAIGVSLIQSGSEGVLTGVASALIILGGALLALLLTKQLTAWLGEEHQR